MNHSPGITGSGLNERQGHSPHYPFGLITHSTSSPGREVNPNMHLREWTMETQILSIGLIIQEQAGLGSGYTTQSSALCQVICAAIISIELQIIHTCFTDVPLSLHSQFLPKKTKKKKTWNNFNNLLLLSIISKSHPSLTASFISAIIVQISPIN